MNAYRPEPTAARTSAPLIWRPWMTRLATLLGIAASPTFVIGGCIALNKLFPGSSAPVWAYAVLVILVFQGIYDIAAIAIAILDRVFDVDGKLAPSKVLLISWDVMLFPCIGLARLARWVVYGDNA